MINENIAEILQSIRLALPPQRSEIDILMKKLDFPIDTDFLQFIEQHDGAEGFLSHSNFVLFWNLEDLVSLNPYYPEVEASKQLFFIGSDGSNFGYAFNKNTGQIVGIDFMEIGRVEPKILASSFFEFLSKLANEE